MLIHRRFHVLSAVLAVSLCSGLAWGTGNADWPVFHGPNGDNHSPATGLLKKWPANGPKMIWTAKGIGHGFSSITIVDRLIYTAGNVDDNSAVTALTLDGKIKWQTPCGKAWTKGPAGTRATPTIDDGRVYYENSHGGVYCLDAKTGKPIWNRDILKDFNGQNITWGLAESLVIDGNNVLCLPAGPEVSMVALNKLTGKTVWKAASADGDKAGYATPIVVEYKGIRMALTMTAKALIGVNVDTGKLLFRFPHKTNYDVNATMPIYKDGQVFISSGYGTTGSVMVKLNVAGGKVTATKVWGSRELDNHHGGVVLVDGYVYAASQKFNKNQWICLDWKTGEMKYADKGVGKGSATYADGMLYTFSEKRVMGLVKPTPASHQLVSQFETPKGPEGPSWAHPVVLDGRLYLRHSDNLYVYDIKG